VDGGLGPRPVLHRVGHLEAAGHTDRRLLEGVARLQHDRRIAAERDRVVHLGGVGHRAEGEAGRPAGTHTRVRDAERRRAVDLEGLADLLELGPFAGHLHAAPALVGRVVDAGEADDEWLTVLVVDELPDLRTRGLGAGEHLALGMDAARDGRRPGSRGLALAVGRAVVLVLAVHRDEERADQLLGLPARPVGLLEVLGRLVGANLAVGHAHVDVDLRLHFGAGAGRDRELRTALPVGHLGADADLAVGDLGHLHHHVADGDSAGHDGDGGDGVALGPYRRRADLEGKAAVLGDGVRDLVDLVHEAVDLVVDASLLQFLEAAGPIGLPLLVTLQVEHEEAHGRHLDVETLHGVAAVTVDGHRRARLERGELRGHGGQVVGRRRSLGGRRLLVAVAVAEQTASEGTREERPRVVLGALQLEAVLVDDRGVVGLGRRRRDDAGTEHADHTERKHSPKAAPCSLREFPPHVG
jgi:hypothetical protein